MLVSCLSCDEFLKSCKFHLFILVQSVPHAKRCSKLVHIHYLSCVMDYYCDFCAAAFGFFFCLFYRLSACSPLHYSCSAGDKRSVLCELLGVLIRSVFSDPALSPGYLCLIDLLYTRHFF